MDFALLFSVPQCLRGKSLFLLTYMNRKPKSKPSLQQKALDLLSRRRLSTGELRAKLLQRKYDSQEIETLLNRYTELGYLDDKSLASDYASARLALKSMSRKLLKFELRKRLLPDDLIDSALSQAYAEISEEECAFAVVQQEIRFTRSKIKVFKKLARLGFSYDLIESALAQFPPDSGWE